MTDEFWLLMPVVRARRKLIRFISTGGCLFFGHLIRLWLTAEQAPDHRDPVPADAVGEEARVTDAVEAGGQHMDQEAANELIRGQAHGLHAVPALDVVVLPAE